MSGLGGMSCSNSPSPTDWTSLLASTLGGGIVGFLSSFLLEPAKRRFLRPKIQISFPIEENTNLEDPSTTPFLVFVGTPNIREHKIVVRAKVENFSKSFSAERCRVYLTRIEQRANREESWRQTDYNEINQVAWSENSFEFEEVDLYPETERSFDFLEIVGSHQIKIRTKQPHPSFSYLFPFSIPIPEYREWKLHFQIAGENFTPKPFHVTIIGLWEEKIKGNPAWKVLVNGCNIDFNAIFRRNPIEGVFT